MPLVNLDGVNIYYEDHGGGPVTYVYCHGLGGNSKFFEQKELDWYKTRFRVITWDNRGLGRSGTAGEYSLPLYAKDLKLLLDYLSVDEAVLFGLSKAIPHAHTGYRTSSRAHPRTGATYAALAGCRLAGCWLAG